MSNLIDKSRREEYNGDQYFNREKFKKAMNCYRKAVGLDPEHLPLYEKLIQTQTKLGKELNDEEFAESLGWTMKKQELENPGMKRVHAQLEPEWNEIVELIKQMMNETDEMKETHWVEKIADYGTLSVYPLIEILLSFKKLGKK